MDRTMTVAPDPALISKYGVNGSRYTSYPSALNFSADIDDRDFEQAVKDSNDELIPRALSLYVHIPFCRTLCYYCGCHKKVTRNPAVVSGYLDTLSREIKLKGQLFDRDREVRQLHFGGGTPTYLNANQRSGLMRQIQSHFTLSSRSDRDYGIEIDPRTIEPREFAQLAALGFNRVSFGVQDTNPTVQQAVNRVHSTAALIARVGAARAAGIQTVSFDLIYGLPLQTPASFAKTLETVCSLQPDSLSVFSYAHLPQMFPAQRLLDSSQLPAPRQRVEIFANTIRQLQDYGYEYVGMDHFARPGSHLAKARDSGDLHRCFQGYASGRQLETLGLGVSAISRVGRGYYQNHKDLKQYATATLADQPAVLRGYVCSTTDQRIGAAIDALMCYGTVKKARWSGKFQADFDEFFAATLKALEPLAADGLIVLSPDTIDVTAQGRLFLRNIAGCFDRQDLVHAKTYSSTV